MSRTNEEIKMNFDFGLVEVFGVRKDGKKQICNEDHSFGIMGYKDAHAIKQNHISGKSWMSQYSSIYFIRAYSQDERDD